MKTLPFLLFLVVFSSSCTKKDNVLEENKGPDPIAAEDAVSYLKATLQPSDSLTQNPYVKNGDTITMVDPTFDSLGLVVSADGNTSSGKVVFDPSMFDSSNAILKEGEFRIQGERIQGNGLAFEGTVWRVAGLTAKLNDTTTYTVDFGSDQNLYVYLDSASSTFYIAESTLGLGEAMATLINEVYAGEAQKQPKLRAINAIPLSLKNRV